MATATLSVGAHRANDLEAIRLLAQDIQIQVHRIESLAEGIDQAIDLSIEDEATRSAIGRATDFVQLLKESAGQASEMAELVEIKASRVTGESGE